MHYAHAKTHEHYERICDKVQVFRSSTVCVHSRVKVRKCYEAACSLAEAREAEVRKSVEYDQIEGETCSIGISWCPERLVLLR